MRMEGIIILAQVLNDTGWSEDSFLQLKANVAIMLNCENEMTCLLDWVILIKENCWFLELSPACE